MIIGSLQKFSLLDYPEHLSAIIFTQGCNFRCHFCYNPMLVWPKQVGKSKYKSASSEDGQKDYPGISEDDLFDFLRERQGKLDAVVVTGGEPTIQADLPEFLSQVKAMDYKIKLDTNGTNPVMLKSLIEDRVLDYLAMDIKAAHDKYDLATGVQPELEKIRESIALIIASRLPHEFRTTLVPHIHSAEDIEKMAEMIKGADQWYLQRFKSDTLLVNADFQATPAFADKDMQAFRKIARGFVKKCAIR